MKTSKKTIVTGTLRVKSDAFNVEKSRWAMVHEVWDEEGLIEHLRERMQMSEAAVRELLQSYSSPVATP